MGASGASLLYGQAENIEPDEEGYYLLEFADLENPSILPQPDDLILNSDGTFYRVVDVDSLNKQMLCAIVSVSGGGGGGGGPTNLAKAISLKGSPLPTVTLVNGQQMEATFVANSAIDSFGEIQDDELTISWNLFVTSTGVNYDSGTFKVKTGESRTFEFGSRLRESTGSTLAMYATGVNSGKSKTLTYEVTTVELLLKQSNKFGNVAPYGSTFTMYCEVEGTIKKILEFYVDGNLVGSKTLAASTIGEQSLTVNDIPHGYHVVKMDLFQCLDDGSKGVGVKQPLEFEIAVNAGDTDPIIWLGAYAQEYYNYDSIKIPYRVFDPNKASTEVTFLKGITELSTRNADSGATAFSIWEVTNTTLNIVNTYYIQVERSVLHDETESKFVRREVAFSVVQDPNRDLSLVSPEALQLVFDAAGRSNTESKTSRQMWSYTDKNTGGKTYTGKFDNFNWYNNGWILDENNDTCLRISNGAKFSIPLGNMILNNPSSSAQQSKTFEFEFKIRNVQDYSNLIKEYTRYSGDQDYWSAFVAQMNDADGYDNYDSYLKYVLSQPGAQTTYDKLTENFSDITRMVQSSTPFCSYYDNNKRGFCLGPQDGFFSSAQNTLNIKYVEDRLINLSIVFSYIDKRIYMYLQGILTAVCNVTDVNALEIGADNIVFTSDYCDVDLYKFRVYNSALSVRDILINYSVDRKSIMDYDHTTQLISYNQTTGEYQLDFASMKAWNNDTAHLDSQLMPYVIWDTGSSANKLPFSKADKKSVGMTFVNTALDRAYQNGELEDLANAMSDVQKAAAAKEGLTLVQYYYKHHCPSFTSIERKVSLGVQGTSSEFYPRRNYKAKTKGTDAAGEDCIYMYMNRGPFAELFITNPEKCQLDFFYYNNYTVGTTKFTMKIDFMESSGTYNMGLANLVDSAYTKHPLDDYNASHAFNKVEYALATGEFDSGMTYYEDNKGSKKVTFTEELPYEKNKYYIPSYKSYTFTDTVDYRTNVQGFPVMAFWKFGETDKDHQFLGRYNMLTDKGSDETFGFKPSKSVTTAFTPAKKGVQSTVRKIAECWEYSDNNRGYCSFRDPQNRHKLSFDMHETIEIDGVQNTERILNSKGSCPVVADSFEYRYNTNADLLDYFYDPETNGSVYEDLLADYTATQLSDINWRSEELLSIYKNWEKACQWVWSTCVDNVPSETDPDFRTKTRKIMTYSAADGEFDSSLVYYNLTEDVVENPNAEDLAAGKYLVGTPSPVTYDKVTYEYDTQEYRRAKFTNELADHFDLEYLLVYFVITEVLLCYDSRGKNCMMASWGPQKAGGEYIWYPIFYDMDTQLGINNTGIPSFEYSENASKDGTFSTSDSVLWQNLFSCFFTNIVNKYYELRHNVNTQFEGQVIGPLSTVDHIEKWYLANPDETGEIQMRGLRPLAMFNMDEFFKYISICNPAIGYQNRQGGMDYDTSGTYFYALQGDRSLSRQQFLARRLNFIDSWLSQGNYSRSDGTEIHGRVGCNNPSMNSDHWITGTTASSDITGLEQNVPYYVIGSNGQVEMDARNQPKKTNYLDADVFVELTPYQDSYVTLGRDNESFGSIEYEGEAVRYNFPTTIQNGIFNSPNYLEALIYIYGASVLSDVGDISKLYWSEFYAKNSPHLQRILLGNDHPDFYNKALKSPDFDAASTSQYGKPLLKEVNLTGIQLTSDSTKDFDFSSSEKMQIFKAVRSNINSVKFASGVALHTLYLPGTVTSLKLTEAANLTKVLTNLSMNPDSYYSTYNESTDEWIAEQGLYIEGLTNVNTSSINANTSCNISEIDIAGGNLGYGSYDLVNTLYQIYKNGEGNGQKELKISLTDVDWSPYRQLDMEAEYDSNITYYTDDNHYGFKTYTYTTPAAWQLALSNKEIYSYDNSRAADSMKIKDIQMLLDFINRAQFKNTVSTGASVPVITGTIYVNNTEPVDENVIRNTLLLNTAFPAEKLNIHFAKVKKGYSARFLQVEEDGTYKVIGTQVLAADSIATQFRFKSPYEMYEAKRDNFDFWGWSTTNSADNVIAAETWATSDNSKVTAGVYDYTFYAVFTRHKFTISYKIGTMDTGFSELLSDKITFGDFLINPAVLPTLDESKLDDLERFKFLGWTQDRTNTVVATANQAKLVNVATMQAMDDYTFYGVFMKESVYDSVTGGNNYADYFEFMELAYTDTADSSFDITGWGISAKVLFNGKVTIPTIHEGKPVVAIMTDGFLNQSGITHVYWDKNNPNEVRRFGSTAFSNCTSLKKIEMPPKLRVLQDYALAGCYQLQQYNFDGNLLTIGGNALNLSIHAPAGKVYEPIYIGGKVQSLGFYAFSNNSMPLKVVEIGAPDDPSQLANIAKPAIRQNMDYEVNELTIYCSADRYTFFTTRVTSGYGDPENYNFQLLGDTISIVQV